MFYIVFAGMLLVSFVVPKDKIQTYIIGLFIWLVYALNTFNPDYLNYQTEFDNVLEKGKPNAEILFFVLMRMVKKLGGNYRIFLCVIGLIYVILLYKSLKRFTPNINIVVGLFVLMPFWIDVVQIRSGLALLIVLYGCTYLFDYNVDTKKAITQYLLYLIIAMLIHQSAFVYIILICSRVFDWKKVFVVTFSGIAVLGLLNTKYFLFVLNYLEMAFGSERFTMWVTRDIQSYTYRFVFIAAIISVVTVFLFNFYSNRLKNISLEHEQKSTKLICNYIDMFSKSTVLTMMFLPMMMRKLEWQRILRIDYIFLAIVISYTWEKRKTNIVYLLFELGLYISIFIFISCANTSGGIPYFDSVFRVVFENNVLVNW